MLHGISNGSRCINPIRPGIRSRSLGRTKQPFCTNPMLDGILCGSFCTNPMRPGIRNRSPNSTTQPPCMNPILHGIPHGSCGQAPMLQGIYAQSAKRPPAPHRQTGISFHPPLDRHSPSVSRATTRRPRYLGRSILPAHAGQRLSGIFIAQFFTKLRRFWEEACWEKPMTLPLL